MATDILERGETGFDAGFLGPVCRLGKGEGKYLGGLNAHFALLLVGHCNSLARTDLQPLVRPGLGGCNSRRRVLLLPVQKAGRSCWRRRVLCGWIQLALGGLEWQRTAAFCLCQMLHPAVGSKHPHLPAPTTTSTSQRAQHKALRTAVHHTASGTHGTCPHVCPCPCQAMHVCAAARPRARIDVHLRACEMQQPR